MPQLQQDSTQWSSIYRKSLREAQRRVVRRRYQQPLQISIQNVASGPWPTSMSSRTRRVPSTTSPPAFCNSFCLELQKLADSLTNPLSRRSRRDIELPKWYSFSAEANSVPMAMVINCDSYHDWVWDSVPMDQDGHLWVAEQVGYFACPSIFPLVTAALGNIGPCLLTESFIIIF